jgi:hypothetical protein
MSEYWRLELGRRQELLANRDYVPDQLMLLFRERDRFWDASRAEWLVVNADVEDDTVEEWDSRHLFGYRATVGELRARLSLQGFGPIQVRGAAVDYLAAEQSDPDRHVPESWRTFDNRSPEKLLDECIAWRKRWHILDVPPKAGSEEQYFSHTWDSVCESFDDPRFALALLLTRAQATTSVTLELSNLVVGGWMEPTEHPHATAQRRLQIETSVSGAVIVVTEGSSDARFLQRALDLARPAVADQFAFLDFEGTSAAGGTDRVVALVKGLAAANVSNRVVAVLDNDCAGRLAERDLSKVTLPSRFSVMRLPRLAYATSYPTVGPEGAGTADINNRAVSIELSFGLDLLRRVAGGQLPPVRWGGYVAALDDYQGAITMKREIKDSLDEALSATGLPELTPELSGGCETLAEALVGAVADVTPLMASQYSPLLRARVHDPMLDRGY